MVEKMKIFNLYIIFFLSISGVGFAQDTTYRSKDLEHEILTTYDTELELLSKGRKLILTKINQDSLQKAAEIADYLDARFQSTQIIPFWRSEREIISLWTRKFDFLLNTENLGPPQKEVGYHQKIVPPRDLLALELQQKAVREKTKLRAGILSSHLAEDEKQFLDLLVATWVVDKSNQKKAQDSLNTLSDRFLFEHPRSRFTQFVKQHIRFVYKPSTWSYGFDLSFAYTGISGNISQYFSDAGALAIGFDISYKHFIFYPRFTMGIANKIKKSFEHPIGVTWNKDLRVQIFIPELTAGYMLVENNFIRIAPFAGVCGVLIEPPENEKSRTNSRVKLNSDASLISGVNFDLRVGKMVNPFFFSYNEKSDWTMKFRIAFINNSYSGTNTAFSGSSMYISIGIGGIGRSMIRDE